LSGCLTYKAVKYEIEFDEDFKNGFIKVTYYDIMSSEKETDKQEEDFRELVKLAEEKDFLLDSMEDGVYVTERKIFMEEGRINGSFTGFFRRLKIDSGTLKANENERTISLEKYENDVIETNGQITESTDNCIITWPKDARNLTFKITHSIDEETYSLLDYYDDWKRKQ
jgi:hypothetical protein